MKCIVIIGGGAFGVSTLVQLVQKLVTNKLNDTKIILIEKNDLIGPGVAYANVEDCHILNLSADVMSPLPDVPGDFIAWAKKNEAVWKNKFPQVDIHTCTYPPRGLFGLYLSDLARTAKIDAESHGIEVEFIQAEATDIDHTESQIFTITLNAVDGQKILVADKVICCIGHLPSDLYKTLKTHSQYCHSPWEIKNKKINETDAIAILGTRLTAIDTLFLLRTMGYAGKVNMISRGGMLPAIIGPTTQYTRKYLTEEEINKLTGYGSRKLPLQKMVELFVKEMLYAYSESTLPFDLSWLHTSETQMSSNGYLETVPAEEEANSQQKLFLQWQQKLELTPASEWIKKELTESMNIRPWQSVLFSLYSIVPKLWEVLNETDKKDFLRNYYSTWMTYLAAFPPENARKIFDEIQNETLEVYSGLKNVAANPDNPHEFILTFTNKEPLIVNHVINATGSGHDITQTDLPLLVNLLRKNLIAPHPVGGIQVDFTTLCAKNNKGTITPGLFIVGDLTWGNFMATEDLHQLSVQVFRVATNLVAELTASPVESFSYEGVVRLLQSSGVKFSSELTSEREQEQGVCASINTLKAC